MKKFKKIIAGSLMALSMSGNLQASEMTSFQKVKNFAVNHKNTAIASTIVFAFLAATYKFGKEGIKNGLFANSNKNLFYKNYSDKEAVEREEKILKNNNNIEPLTLNYNDKVKLSGYIYKPNTENIKKVILVFGGNSELACQSLKYAVDRDKQNNTSCIYMSFDFPTYGKSGGSKLNEEVMKTFADKIYDYAVEKYPTLDLSVYGYSLGGYAGSYLGSKEKVKELNLWSPVKFDSAVQGLTKVKPLGSLARIWGTSGDNFDSIKNIKNSHKDCKINLFSGSCKNGDFLSLEMSVLGEKSSKEDFEVSKEVWEKLVENSKNDLGNRLTVSFVSKYGHSNHEFEHDIWDVDSIWDTDREKNKI